MIKTENLTILFVDIAGFTATTSRQSRVENARLLQTFGSTLLPLIKGYKGKLIKTIGDALLITFRSPTDAMLCSMALQDAMHAHNLSARDGEKIHIRVAANLGEVRVTKNDIFGEPVNVASRIEGVAPADEIYLSEAVYMAMNKAEVPAREVGSKELAGVSQPVRLYNIPRFSTPRLVAENADTNEKGSELLYPYGGMHCHVRHKGFSELLHIPGNKKITRLLIPGFALCAVAVGLAVGYNYLKKTPSDTPVTMQSSSDEAQPALPVNGNAQQVNAENQIVTASEANDAKVAKTAETGSPADLEKPLTTAVEGAVKVAGGGKASSGAEIAKTTRGVADGISNVTSSGRRHVVSDPAGESSGTDTVIEPEDETDAGYGNQTIEKTPSIEEPAPAGEDATAWNITTAKEAYRASKLSRVEYSKITRDLKVSYEKKLRQLKLDLRSGKITRAEYDQAVQKAKMEYSGQR